MCLLYGCFCVCWGKYLSVHICTRVCACPCAYGESIHASFCTCTMLTLSKPLTKSPFAAESFSWSTVQNQIQARRLLKHASETLRGIRQNDNIASLHLTILAPSRFRSWSHFPLASLLSHLKDNSHWLGELHCVALQKCTFSCVWVWERARERQAGRGSGKEQTNS